MDIQRYTVGPFGENTYLLTKDNQALVIDPGFVDDAEFEKVQSQIAQLDLIGVVLTHAHVDHVLGLNRLLEQYDVPVYLSDKDRYLWKNFSSQAAMFGLKAKGFDFEPEPLPVQSSWQIGNFTFDVRYTPGHAPDHISLYIPDSEAIIAGDIFLRRESAERIYIRAILKSWRSRSKKSSTVYPEVQWYIPGTAPKQLLPTKRIPIRL
ncbi:MAG: MBL fold metallo-hydrolase [Fodinibius sp.]|nr:MBL fold metallo-hydrolase [Fodinibius sp.]